jgi:hypothetical protein
MGLIYNLKCPVIDSHMSDSNIGARKTEAAEITFLLLTELYINTTGHEKCHY